MQADLSALFGLRDRYGAAYPRGRAIVREGAADTDLFVVLEGQVEFSVMDRQSGLKKVLGLGTPGEFFGEVSCFSGKPRSATATAVNDVTVLRFDNATALQLIRASPDFALRIIKLLSDRVYASAQLLANTARP